MRRTSGILAAAIALISSTAAAQASSHPHLHINSRWHECSFQLDASLTPEAWRQFTKEAGLVTYFRPMSDARPMGKGKLEVSVLQWKTGIDDADAAWNDTFVHPDSVHYLFEGDALAFPGLMGRVGLSEKMDLGVYLTKSPGANYGFYGAQLQRSLIGAPGSKWALAARASFVSMYGPEDVEFAVAGADVLGSRTFRLSGWASVSPYAGLTHYVARSHEKSAVVTLADETELGSQGVFGTAIELKAVRLGMEYNVARVRSVNMKIGVGF